MLIMIKFIDKIRLFIILIIKIIIEIFKTIKLNIILKKYYYINIIIFNFINSYNNKSINKN